MILSMGHSSPLSINVAIVDDSQADLEHCLSLLKRFEKESDTQISADSFSRGGSFLEKFKGQYDIIFLDVNLDAFNGIEIAKKIRLSDSKVIIIFVTNLARYATEGYMVDALDYVLKPLQYGSFFLKMSKAVSLIQNRASESLVVSTKSGFKKIHVDKILYLEVFSHDVVFHLDDESVVTSGTLKEYDEKLRKYDFLRCKSCYLVNAEKIEGIYKYDIRLSNGETIEISHPKRKEFIRAFKDYIARTGG